MYHPKFAAGLDLEEVQFTRTISPAEYLALAPSIWGPSRGKSVKENGIEEGHKHRQRQTHCIAYYTTLNPLLLSPTCMKTSGPLFAVELCSSTSA